MTADKRLLDDALMSVRRCRQHIGTTHLSKQQKGGMEVCCCHTHNLLLISGQRFANTGSLSIAATIHTLLGIVSAWCGHCR
jgi:hypothetical protein